MINYLVRRRVLFVIVSVSGYHVIVWVLQVHIVPATPKNTCVYYGNAGINVPSTVPAAITIPYLYSKCAVLLDWIYVVKCLYSE